MSLAQLEKTLKLDIKAALGCTEPITIALATCKARRLTSAAIAKITLRLSTNLLKNAMEVGIPGTGGQRGIPLAAALGCFSAAENPGLTLLEGMSKEWLEQARNFVERDLIDLDLASEKHGLFVDALVEDTQGNTGRCVISGSHENCVLLEKNGMIVYSSNNTGDNGSGELLRQRQALAGSSFTEIWNSIADLSEDLREHMLQGIEMNLKVAEAGMNNDGFLHIGNIYNSLIKDGWLGNDVVNRAKAITSAAVDARMSGCDLPVMTSAGSGNQGLTITLPLQILAEHLKSDRRKLSEALAIAHGITSILKHHSGTLSAMCGCVVCSGTGLTAGATYLLGGTLETATAAINNMVGSITGIICDGAKVGCSIKLVCAVDSAFQAAMMAMRGLKLPTTNGVLGDTLETSLANIGLIAAPGMLETDDQILAIMLGKPVKPANAD
ncbi:MAG: L-serine ammonia-lyase, iron-sulfur-dependent, subunit alpha [Candidatus Riflebacteria bacterium]|nr:L-serine ammonia-lyase, iron-sulfur-dependent, subunit alpha [Candidatus Riflebacteria bacterium]